MTSSSSGGQQGRPNTTASASNNISNDDVDHHHHGHQAHIGGPPPHGHHHGQQHHGPHAHHHPHGHPPPVTGSGSHHLPRRSTASFTPHHQGGANRSSFFGGRNVKTSSGSGSSNMPPTVTKSSLHPVLPKSSTNKNNSNDHRSTTTGTRRPGNDFKGDTVIISRVTSDHKNIYKTSCPLFTVKGDDELDKFLNMAMQKSKSNGQMTVAVPHQKKQNIIDDDDDIENGVSGGKEVIVCEGFPPAWKNFYDDRLLCDCVIQASDGKDFHVHRCILAASCPYFYARFYGSNNNNQKTGGPDTSTMITLQTLDSKTLQAIIDFAYTGDFEKNSVDAIAKLLPIAAKFKMTPVLQQCCEYLVETAMLRPENALRIYSFCRPYFCSKLENKAKSFILHNFRQVVRTADFLQLDAEQLKVFLKDDHLNARNEAMVFEAIRAWVDHSPYRRRKNIPDLLSCVRFGLMSYGYFTNVVYQWHFVNEDEHVRRALDAPSVLLTSIDSLNNTDVDLNDPLARPRIPYEVIFAVGGWSAGSPTAFIETYDIRADRWFLLNNTDSTPRAYHGLVSLGQYVYMIGGFDGQEHFSTVKRYDPVSQMWEERSCMLFARCYVSCCQLDSIIYACGGYNGRTRMNSAEKYLPDLNQWELIAPMNRQRSDASAASLKGKVYIAGGFTGTEVLNSVETFDPAEGQWTFIQPMNTARSGVSLVAYRDCLYAVGGFNGFNRLNTAERYDPGEPGPWSMIPEMSSARSNFAAVCADELLICIGGFNGATTIPYVECYDSKVNEWFDASHMNLNRSALSACVVTNLSNAREYSYLHRIQELLGLPNEQMDIDP